MTATNDTPRNAKGRFLKTFCSDPNCDGSLILDSPYGEDRWICDGLTHMTDSGPLQACNRSYSASIGADNAK